MLSSFFGHHVHREKSNVNFPSSLETFPIIVTGISQILCEFLLIFKGISQNHEILQKKCKIPLRMHGNKIPICLNVKLH